MLATGKTGCVICGHSLQFFDNSKTVLKFSFRSTWSGYSLSVQPWWVGYDADLFAGVGSSSHSLPCPQSPCGPEITAGHLAVRGLRGESGLACTEVLHFKWRHNKAPSLWPPWQSGALGWIPLRRQQLDCSSDRPAPSPPPTTAPKAEPTCDSLPVCALKVGT